MFLISTYMERGRLFRTLSKEARAVGLDWIKRVNIVKNVAHALSYMHHYCTPPIIHRDISSNNIILNSEFEGFVSDFGIARLLNLDSSNRTLVVGTYGYIAPGKCIHPLLIFLLSFTYIYVLLLVFNVFPFPFLFLYAK